MRFAAKHAVHLLLLGLVCGSVFAQQTPQSRDGTTASSSAPKSTSRRASPPAVRLLSLDEGLSILGAALESRVRLGPNADCSHLVHDIYERAGFPYPYVPSSELYAGIREFRRVTRPQAGDLVTWPGHAGLAISGVQHTFYSALRTGLGVENYEAPYWKSRGRPRFYRYIKSGPATLNAASRPARVAPTTFGDSEPRGDQEKSAMRPQTSLAPDADTAIPTTAAVDSARPTAGEINDALARAFSDTSEALRGKDVLTQPQPLVVFDELEVARMHLDRRQGWVEVTISRPSLLTKGQARRTGSRIITPERQRWTLRYAGRNSWEVVLPREIYLPRDAAVKVLAHQLASATDNPQAPSADPQKAELARLLNTLLQN
jgi:hypothetical protein